MQRILLIALSAVAVFSANANAALIGSFDGQEATGSRGASDSILFSMGYAFDRGTDLREPIIFSLLLTGDTTAFADSGRAFEIAAEEMTDGVIRPFGTRSAFSLDGELTGSVNGSGFPESDFSGFLIEAFVLTVTGFSLLSPGSDPNGDGNWTDLAFDWRVDVYGQPVDEVPIPAAAALFLLGLGGLVLAGFARRRARRSGVVADFQRPHLRKSNHESPGFHASV